MNTFVQTDLGIAPGELGVAATSELLPAGTVESVTDPTSQRDAPEEVIALAAEQIEIHKRLVETGRVRVVKRVQTEEQVVDVSTAREEIRIERVPVERFVAEAPPVRQEGNVTIISVVEEVLVVERRLMVREEVRLVRTTIESHEPRSVMLRKETLDVDRTG